MPVENEQSVPRHEAVAQRWMKMQGISRPEAGGSPEEEDSAALVRQAYDLFVERSDLNTDIFRKQRQVMEPNQSSFAAVSSEWSQLLEGTIPSHTLSLESKRELIQQGKVADLLSSVENIDKPLDEVVSKSQVRIKEIDERLDQVFKLPGVYENFQSDLSHQVRTRHQAREALGLERLSEQLDLIGIRIARRSQIQGRSLTSVEKQFIDENRVLKEEAERRRAEFLEDTEVFERVRILELQEYQRQLQKDHFAETQTRKGYLRRTERYWSEGKRVLLTGETGTGKTELIKYASERLFGVSPEYVTGHQDMSIYELLGKTGFQIQEGDVFRPAPMIRAMTGRDGKGLPFLFDEMDRAPNQSVMGIKTVLNARAGEKGLRIQTDTAGTFDVGPDYAVAATANIKSEKYATATELDPAIVRMFDAPMDVDYMPPYEVYDLALATLMDRRGGITLSERDATVLLKNLCDAASWIQDAYQGKQVITDPQVGIFLEARGQAATGKPATLKKALLDPGRTLEMLKGLTAASASGIGFEDYLNVRIIEFVNNRAYPEEDRYYLVEIFALKGFLRGHSKNELMVSELSQDTLNGWTGTTRQRGSTAANIAYLSPDRVARLDPYGRFKRRITQEAQELLEGEEEGEEELPEQVIDKRPYIGPKDMRAAPNIKRATIDVFSKATAPQFTPELAYVLNRNIWGRLADDVNLRDLHLPDLSEYRNMPDVSRVQMGIENIIKVNKQMVSNLNRLLNVLQRSQIATVGEIRSMSVNELAEFRQMGIPGSTFLKIALG